MKRLAATVAALVTVIGFSVTSIPTASATVTCATHFAGRGSGAAGDPYLVSSALDLDAVRDCLSSHFLQTANITLSGDWIPIGGPTLADPFTGTFDGGNFTINGLANTNAHPSPTRDAYGLFLATNAATLQNITLTGVNITVDWDNVGALVGHDDGGWTTIRNCHVTGSVDAVSHSNVGGIVGSSDQLDLVDVTVGEGTISGLDNVGGIVGSATITTISGFATTSYVVTNADVRGRGSIGGVVGSGTDVHLTRVTSTGNVEGSTKVGGLMGSIAVVGVGQNATVESAKVTGNVSTPASATTQERIGGLIGFVDPMPPGYAGRVSVNESVAHGNITFGNASIPARLSGGLIGEVFTAAPADAVSVTNSYSDGRIFGASGEYLGGLVGSVGVSNDFSFNRVYSTSSVPLGTDVGGLFGVWGGFSLQGFWNPTAASPTTVSAAGTESTEALMKVRETYADQGWGIIEGWESSSNKSWGICPLVNNGYPFLLREYDTNPCVPGGVAEGPAPAPVLQQFGKPIVGTCDENQPEGLNWAGVPSGGWATTWAQWMNDRSGGEVCSRTLVYSAVQRRWTVAA